MKENFLNLEKGINIQMQGGKRISAYPNKMRLRLRHIAVKLPRVRNKERILKLARVKKQITYNGTLIRLPLDFSGETLQTRGKWSNAFQIIKNKNCQSSTTK